MGAQTAENSFLFLTSSKVEKPYFFYIVTIIPDQVTNFFRALLGPLSAFFNACK